MKKLIPFLFIALLSCNQPLPVQEEITEQSNSYNKIPIDSLVLLADEAVNEVQHTISDLGADVKIKEKTIGEQLKELEYQKQSIIEMHDKAELKRLEAIAEREKAQKDIAYADTLYSHLQQEMDKQWAEYNKTIKYLDGELFEIGKVLNQAVEDIVVVVIEYGQVNMLYDKTTKINYLTTYLSQERIDSLISNTPILYKVEIRKNRKNKAKLNIGK